MTPKEYNRYLERKQRRQPKVVKDLSTLAEELKQKEDKENAEG